MGRKGRKKLIRDKEVREENTESRFVKLSGIRSSNGPLYRN